MRHVAWGAVLAGALTASLTLTAPPAEAAPDPCQPGFVLTGLFCLPGGSAVPTPAPVTPPPAAPPAAPTPHRSLLDRILGRNRPAPAPAQPARPTAPVKPVPPAANPAPLPTPPPPTPAAPTPSPAPAAPPPLVPIVILPAPVNPGPTPDQRTVWLQTCVDLYAANTHLLTLDNQVVDIPNLAYVLLQCGSNSTVLPVVPLAPSVPGQPPSAGSQTVLTHLPVTG